MYLDVLIEQDPALFTSIVLVTMENGSPGHMYMALDVHVLR